MAMTQGWRDYAKQGGGVHFPFGVPKRGELARIEKLGKINDDWQRFRGSRSFSGLFRVAAAYDRIGCPTLAAIVRHEAHELKRESKKHIGQEAILENSNHNNTGGVVHDAIPVTVLQRSRILLKVQDIFLW